MEVAPLSGTFTDISRQVAQRLEQHSGPEKRLAPVELGAGVWADTLV